jgi:hypothetical protein
MEEAATRVPPKQMPFELHKSKDKLKEYGRRTKTPGMRIHRSKSLSARRRGRTARLPPSKPWVRS